MAEMEVLRALDAIFETFRNQMEDMMVIVPSLNMFETGNEVVVQVALPGVKKEDVKISFSDGYLVIRAYRRKLLSEEESPRFRVLEISSGMLRRSIYIGNEVDPESATTRFEDGILEIRFSRKKPVSVELDIKTEE